MLVWIRAKPWLGLLSLQAFMTLSAFLEVLYLARVGLAKAFFSALKLVIL